MHYLSAFRDKTNFVRHSARGREKMRAEKVEGLRADVENLLPTIAEVEKQIEGLERNGKSVPK